MIWSWGSFAIGILAGFGVALILILILVSIMLVEEAHGYY